MSELFIVIRKEFWEWRYSLKKLAMLGVIFLFPLIAYKSEGTIFVAASSVGGVVIILAAVVSTSYITSESILAEKKNKTMEFLLSTRLSHFSIVIGKIIPGLIIGSILAIIIFIIFSMTSMLILIAILGILKGLTVLNFTLYSLITIPVLLLMNTITTLFARKILVKTKLFLKI